MTERRLWLAVGSAGLGGLLFAVGPLLAVAGADAPAGFVSWPLLALLAIAPVAVAAGFAGQGRRAATSAMLAVLAVIGVGRLIGDIQLVVDSGVVARPELLVATTLSRQVPGAGAWLVLVGHVLTVLGGVLARDSSAQRDASDEPHRGLLAATVVCGVWTAVGLVMAPFSSDNPFLPAAGVLDSSALPLVGGLLVALAVPVAAAVAVSSGDQETIWGGLIGTSFAVLAIAAPPAVAGWVVTDLHPGWGPYIALVGAVGFALICVVFISVPRNHAPDLSDSELPGSRGLHVATGVLGLVTAVAALLGAVLPKVVVPADVVLDNSADRPLVVAALLLGLLSVGLLVRPWSALVRPAFVVACAAIPFAAAAPLESVLSATAISSVHSGVGVWFIWPAVLLAITSAVVAATAGTAERDDADLSDLGTSTAAVQVPVIAAVVLAIGAFGLATVSGAGYQAPGIWSNIRLLASSGLVVGLLAVVGAALLALKSRPVRASGLLLGAAGLVAIRLLEFPLTSGRVAGATVGAGTWLALACLVALVIAAVLVPLRTATKQSP